MRKILAVAILVGLMAFSMKALESETELDELELAENEIQESEVSSIFKISTKMTMTNLSIWTTRMTLLWSKPRMRYGTLPRLMSWMRRMS